MSSTPYTGSDGPIRIPPPHTVMLSTLDKIEESTSVKVTLTVQLLTDRETEIRLLDTTDDGQTRAMLAMARWDAAKRSWVRVGRPVELVQDPFLSHLSRDLNAKERGRWSRTAPMEVLFEDVPKEAAATLREFPMRFVWTAIAEWDGKEPMVHVSNVAFPPLNK